MQVIIRLLILSFCSNFALAANINPKARPMLVGINNPQPIPILLSDEDKASNKRQLDAAAFPVSVNTGSGSGTIEYIASSHDAGTSNIIGFQGGSGNCTATNTTSKAISTGNFPVTDDQTFYFSTTALSTIMKNKTNVYCIRIGVYDDTSRTNGVDFLLKYVDCTSATDCVPYGAPNPTEVCVIGTYGSWTSSVSAC